MNWKDTMMTAGKMLQDEAKDMVRVARDSDRNDRDLAVYFEARLWDMCSTYNLMYMMAERTPPCAAPENSRTPTRQEPPGRQSG